MSEPKRILIVDDEPEICVLLSQQIDYLCEELKIPVQVDFKISGELGVDSLARFKYDLIFLDLSIPDLHGNEILEKKLSSEINRETAVVVLSGYIKEHSWNTHDKVIYLAKPISQQRLKRYLEFYLRPMTYSRLTDLIENEDMWEEAN